MYGPDLPNLPPAYRQEYRSDVQRELELSTSASCKYLPLGDIFFRTWWCSQGKLIVSPSITKSHPDLKVSWLERRSQFAAGSF
jgi:hypothetical protein